MSEIDRHQIIQAFLQTQSTLALATTNAAGQPEIAPLFYVVDDMLNLYWLSSPTSRHSLNLTERHYVAAAIYSSVWQWQDVTGLQIEGTAQAIKDDRIREQILNLYLRKFQLPGEFEATIGASTLYQLTPRWIRWLDNSVSFRYHVEINL